MALCLGLGVLQAHAAEQAGELVYIGTHGTGRAGQEQGKSSPQGIYAARFDTQSRQRLFKVKRRRNVSKMFRDVTADSSTQDGLVALQTEEQTKSRVHPKIKKLQQWVVLRSRNIQIWSWKTWKRGLAASWRSIG
jgi:hypothetical protein